MKKCTKCEENKSLTFFYNDKRFKDGKYPSCKKCKSLYKKEYRIKNIAKLNERHANYIINNRDSVNKYCREKYNKDINYKLGRLIRNRLWYLIKSKSNNVKAIKEIGCSYEELIEHIESNFIHNMNWNNYGVLWELDHIQPLSKFNLENKTQFNEASHYTNIRPLYVSENRRYK